nr:MAG TPA: hypothetical protein [Caudoviricetes sp.]
MTIIIRPKSYIKKKRAGNGEEILKRLEDFLKNNTAEPIKILCRFWQDQQNAITYQELREAVVNGKLDENTFMEWSRDYSFLLNNKFKHVLTTAIEAGSYSQPLIQTLNGYRFNNQTPAILNWIQQRGSELVTNCANEQKEAINLLLSKAVIDNNSTEEIARYIRPCIGLTKGQAQANLKYYNNIVNTLKEEHPKMKLESIQTKAREAATKYAERQHRQRALTIAQTEMATAYNKGADESIRQAQAQRLIGTVKKRWSTSGDDAVCTRCSSLEGVEIDMYSKFAINARSTGEGLTPPAHPRCACAIEYIEVEAPKFESNMLIEDEYLKLSEVEIKVKNELDIMTRNNPPIPILNIENENIDNIINIVENAPKVYKKVFLENVDNICFAKTNCYGKLRFNKKYGIFINFKHSNLKNDKSYDAVFHEIGHNIDFIYGNISENIDFERLLKLDAEEFINNNLADMQISKSEFFNIMDEEIKQYSRNKIHIVSDLFSAIYTEHKWKYRHKPKYWERPFALEHELFAHFFSASIRNNEEELDIIKTVFGRTYKLFDEVLKEISKYV